MSGQRSWLSSSARALAPSMILRIAEEVRQARTAGRDVVNFTIGDFDARAFPLAPELSASIAAALAAGATTYPPMEGVATLREAIVRHTERTHGFRPELSSVLVASGARPVCYATYAAVLDAGDTVLYGAPSWANPDLAALVGARCRVLEGAPEQGFLPDPDEVVRQLGDARLLCLNTPLNPTGTMFDEAALRRMLEGVVTENEGRLREGRPPLFVMYDQVYGELLFEPTVETTAGYAARRVVHPTQLVPACAPWVVTIDAISKSMAATGLRVGWALVPESLYAAMRDIVCHVGGWAPTPIQVALATYLTSDAAGRHLLRIRTELGNRMSALITHLELLRQRGLPIDFVRPHGGLYLAVKLDWKGRRHGEVVLADDDATRRLLLERAGVAVVPFEALSAREGTGWFRLSVGAADVPSIDKACEALGALLLEIT